MDERKFQEVVKTIESAEKDVDKVLKAARLERHEKQSARLELIEALMPGAVLVFCLVWMLALIYILR